VEHGVRYLAALRSGQKTGAFLDQRENRRLAGEHTAPGGRALDCFTYHGSFALHLAARAGSVLAVDQSAEALARGARNAALNALTNVRWREANAFDVLQELERARERFDTIVIDPPAFAKSRESVPRALAGYKEVNLRAMRILPPGGPLHLFLLVPRQPDPVRRMLADAAADSERRLQVVTWTGAAPDHPELLTVPETGYLKGALLRALD
jgi:23S rRNA (cytosine1962-C5)-methyltransferase